MSGRYVLAVTNATDTDGLGAGFLQAPSDVTVPDVIDALTRPGRLPSWYDEATLAGGATSRRRKAAVVVDLPAGHWILWTGDPGSAQSPVPITVSDQAPNPSDVATVGADLTVTATERTLVADGTLAAGSQTVAFVNTGEQPAALLVLEVPEGTTAEQVTDVLTGDVAPFGVAATEMPYTAGTTARIHRRRNLVLCQPRSGHLRTRAHRPRIPTAAAHQPTSPSGHRVTLNHRSGAPIRRRQAIEHP